MTGAAPHFSLAEIMRSLWARKWPLGVFTVVCTTVSITAVLLLPNVYRAEATLAPKQPEQIGGLPAVAAQYGGLANLAGINLAGQSIDRTALGLEILTSRRFLSEFIDRHDILVPLMAARGWDRATGELEIDSSIYDATAGTWVRKVGPPRNSVPSLQEASEQFLNNVLTVSQDSATGFVTVAVEHYSPDVAQAWVDWLVRDLNSAVMRQDVSEAEEAIKYLEQQIAATPVADLQNVFFNLIEQQTKTVMLARMSPEYLFRTIDPAVAPEWHARPRRSLVVVATFVLSLLIGALAVILIDSRTSRTN